MPPTEVARLYPLARGETPEPGEPADDEPQLTTDRDDASEAPAPQTESQDGAALSSLPAPTSIESQPDAHLTDPPDWLDVFDSASYRRHPRRRRRAWFLVGILIATATTALAWPNGNSTGEDQPSEAVTRKVAETRTPEAAAQRAPAAPVASRPSPTPYVPPAPPDPSPTAYARLVLSSEPPGARVLRDGDLLCIAPCDVSVPAGEDAEVLLLQRKGFPLKEVEIFLGAGLTVRRLIRLEPATSSSPKKPAAKPANAKRQRRPARTTPTTTGKEKEPAPEPATTTPRRALPAFRGRLEPETEK